MQLLSDFCVDFLIILPPRTGCLGLIFFFCFFFFLFQIHSVAFPAQNWSRVVGGFIIPEEWSYTLAKHLFEHTHSLTEAQETDEGGGGGYNTLVVVAN